MQTPVDKSERYRQTRRVTVIGAVANAILSATQVTFGVIGQSQALVADGIHTLSDLVSDGMVLLASRIGARDADEDHPYGHARFETIATFSLASLLLVVAVELAWHALGRLTADAVLPTPGKAALIAAFAGIAVKESMYHYTRRVAKRIRSSLLHANAWHHRSDAISSIVVVIGIGGAMLGWSWLDPIAAMLVAAMIVKVALELAWPSLQELVDAGLEPDKVQAIRETILEVPGVQGLHVLRTRRHGHEALVDVHIQVGARLTVSEGHHIGERVRFIVVNKFEEVADVLVHVDPEDDEVHATCEDLPHREKLVKRLRAAFRELHPDSIERVNLHYVAGKVDAELILPLSLLETQSAEELRHSFQQAAGNVEEIREVRLYFH